MKQYIIQNVTAIKQHCVCLCAGSNQILCI